MASFENPKTSAIEVRHLRAFAAVYDELHFGRAAGRLGIPQPQLSLIIKRLEDVVGHPLFVRRPAVQPTPAADAFVRHVRLCLADLEEGLSSLNKAASGGIGTVALGYPTWVAATFVPDALARFRERHPEVNIRLQTLHTREQLAALRAGRLDFAFVRDVPEPADLTFLPLFTEQWMVAVPADHPKSGQEGLAPADLSGEALVGAGPASPWIQQTLDRVLAQAGVAAQLSYQAQSWYSILSLVRAGAGVAVVPQSQASVWPEAIRYLPFRAEDFLSTVLLAHAPILENPAARAFKITLLRCRDGARRSPDQRAAQHALRRS